MRNRFTRASYIPKGALCVRAKGCSAVAYIYANASGALYALAFHGKAERPDWHYRFSNEASRETRVRNHFAHWSKIEAGQVARRAERKAWDSPYKVGDVFMRSWGYDQTNVDYYEITALIGAKMVEVRELRKARKVTGWESGQCVPLPGEYEGEAERRMVGSNGIKINDYAHAHFVEPVMVGGVKTYPAARWSSYA